MNNYQLMCALESVASGYKYAVCAADRLPGTITHFPQGFIVNTDKYGQVGKHWIAIWLEDATTGQFFDSYGKKPIYYGKGFKHFLTKQCDFHDYNQKVLQSPDTVTCGFYCVYYIMLKTRGYSLSQILSDFSDNTYANDAFVRYFANDYLNDCL